MLRERFAKKRGEGKTDSLDAQADGGVNQNEPTTSQSPLEDLQQVELAQRLGASLSELKPPMGDILSDFFLHSLRYEEIANKRGVAVGSVGVYLKRGVDAMRRIWLAYVARRGGQWEQSESFFNQAERLDPRNVTLLSQHALSYILLRRFPEALLKLDQVLNITPDDVDTLALKASIAQAEGDLPRASAILGPLHPAADNTAALETQVYQAILERRPDQIIVRLKEILARPDPAMGYFNGELRFWLGWAQEVAGDHVAAQESSRHAQTELERFLQEQPENYNLMHDLALVEMGLGNKTAALSMAERAIAANPIQKDVVDGPASIEIHARVAAQTGDPDRSVTALQQLLSIPYEGALPVGNAPLTPALLRLDPMFDPLRNDPRFQKLCEQKQP